MHLISLAFSTTNDVIVKDNVMNFFYFKFFCKLKTSCISYITGRAQWTPPLPSPPNVPAERAGQCTISPLTL